MAGAHPGGAGLAQVGISMDLTTTCLAATGVAPDPACPLDELRVLWEEGECGMLPIPLDFVLPSLDLSRMLW